MADSYLSISQIAADNYMNERMRACAVQQNDLGSITVSDPLAWVSENAYLWAASPGWGEKWDSALVSHEGNSAYQPGSDSSVITDGDILSTVQALGAREPGE
jgi:hypothetical protein